MAATLDGWFEAYWGTIPVLASEIRTDNSRTQVVHELSSGDFHPVQDRGLRARRVHCKLLFDQFHELPVEQTPIKLFQAFKAAVDSGSRATFVHPLGGSFAAVVGDFTYEVDKDSIITADVEFIQDGETRIAESLARETGLGTGGVSVAAKELDKFLSKAHALEASASVVLTLQDRINAAAKAVRGTVTEANKVVQAQINRFAINADVDLPVALTAEFSAALTSELVAAAGASASADGSAVAHAGASVSATVAAHAYAEASAGRFAAATIDARVAVSSWALTEDVPTRQILIDVARISDNLETLIQVARLEHDLALWPAYRQTVLLAESVRAAAIAATSETPSVFLMRIVTSTALLPLAARIYGGAEATDRARQIASLNDVATRGWLPPGDYVMPNRSPAQRSRF